MKIRIFLLYIRMYMYGGWLYILSNNSHVLYIGVTSDLSKRLNEHRLGKYSGFTYKYKIYQLVYFEKYDDIRDAIAREKQLKNWHREWKLNLIKSVNPEFMNIDPETPKGPPGGSSG